MSKFSLLCTLLGLQASCAAAGNVKLHVAADGTIGSAQVDAQTADVQGLLSEVEEMVKDGATPDDEKIKTIDELIDQLLPVLEATRDTRQGEVHANIKDVKDCNAVQAREIAKINSTIKQKTDGLRKQHRDCREKEKQIHADHKNKTCKTLTDYLTEIEENSPQKPDNTDDDDAMVEWVVDMSTYWCGQGKVADEKDDACKKAKKAHDDHKKKCDALQEQFETDYCTWRIELINACDEQTSCYDREMAEYKDHKAETLELVKKWKVEFVALKKMSCYINVWLTEKAKAFKKTSTADAGELEKCKALTPDETKMEVSFPKCPAMAPCPREEVKNYPGTDGFKDTEYVNDFPAPAFVIEPLHCLKITEPEGY